VNLFHHISIPNSVLISETAWAGPKGPAQTVTARLCAFAVASDRRPTLRGIRPPAARCHP
jgi:hypothetical protein